MRKSTSPKTVVLFGRTGAGKSTLGNKLAGEVVFQPGHTLISETGEPKAHTCVCPYNSNVTYKIIDNPGFGDNRADVDGTAIVIKILKFLTELGQDGLNIGIYCIPGTKTRLDQTDIDEMQMLASLLGEEVFDYLYIAVTQLDVLDDSNRKKCMENFTRDMPTIFAEHGFRKLTQDKILFATMNDFGKFMNPLLSILDNAPSRVPQVNDGVDFNNPESVQKLMYSKQVTAVLKQYEDKIAAQQAAIEKSIADNQQLAGQVKGLESSLNNLKDMNNKLSAQLEGLKNRRNSNWLEKIGKAVGRMLGL